MVQMGDISLSEQPLPTLGHINRAFFSSECFATGRKCFVTQSNRWFDSRLRYPF